MVAAPVRPDRADLRSLARGQRAGRSDPRDVASRIVALARAGAPLRRSLAAIAGRVVATRAWERLGFARLADYARERAGLSARQVHDLAHVDAALTKLPRIEAAFATGALTWTKARLLVRVATPEDEVLWIDATQHLTARVLAREVRAVDARALEAGGVETDEEGRIEEPRETLVLRLDLEARDKWSQARLFACFNSGERLERWQVAEAVAAEVLSAIPLDDIAARALEGSAHGCAGDGAPGSHPILRSAHACTVEEATGSHPHPGASEPRAPGAAHGCTPHAVEPAPTPFLRALVEGLGEADAFELDARLRRAVRLEQRLCAEMGPLLLDLARTRGYRDYGCPSLDPDPHTGARPRAPAGHASPYYLYGCPRDVARLFRAVLATVQRRIERRADRPASESEALCAMLDHALESWGAHRKVPTEHRVFARDGWRCTAPGCTSYRNLHDHHIRFRSAGGSDGLSNRTTLCAWHHLRGVHAGVVRCTGHAPHALRFELGVRPGRAALATYRSGDVAC